MVNENGNYLLRDPMLNIMHIFQLNIGDLSYLSFPYRALTGYRGLPNPGVEGREAVRGRREETTVLLGAPRGPPPRLPTYPAAAQ